MLKYPQSMLVEALQGSFEQEAIKQTQPALRFYPLPLPIFNLKELSVTSNLILYPGLLPMLRTIAKRWSFVRSGIAPVPDEKRLQRINSSIKVVDIKAAGICGSDVATRLLSWPKSSLVDKGDIISPFTIGHEIVVQVGNQLYVVYAPFTCESRGLPQCPACKNGDQNLCENFASIVDKFTGQALGFGLQAWDEDRRKIEMGGGVSRKIAVNLDTQLFPIGDMTLERACFIDDYACAIHAVNELKKDSDINKESQLLLIGLGSLGATTLNYLVESGFKNITVLAKYQVQENLAKWYEASGVKISVIDANDPKKIFKLIKNSPTPHKTVITPVGPWLEGGYPFVIDCVGSAESLNLALNLTQQKGKLLLLGMPGEIRHDFHLQTRREIKLIPSFWATPADFEEAIDRLASSNFPWEKIIKPLNLKNAMQAFNPSPENKQNYIKYMIIPE